MPSLKPAQLAFFSYAHEDAEFALRLAKDLRAGGAAVWIDRLDIKPGQRWDRAIEDALAKCSQLLLILSPDATESTNVMDEVSLALEEGKTVLPVVHRQCKIPFRLRRLQYVDLTRNYNEGLGQLLETLGLGTPSSKTPEEAVDLQVPHGSDHDGGAAEVNLLSRTAPHDHKPTLPMPKKPVFGPAAAIVGGLAILLIGLTGLLVALNHLGVFKQTEKKPTAPLKAEESVAAASAAKTLKNAARTTPSTAAPSPMATVAEKRARDYESAIAYNKSGIKKAQTGDFAGALADYDHAIELDPGFVEAYNNRAGAKERIGDLPGALDDCGRAIEIDPNYSLAYAARAGIHYEMRDFRAAIDDFQRALKIAPRAEWLRLFVWLAEMHLGQKERADRELAEYFGDRIKAPEQDRTVRIAAFLLDKLTLAEFLAPQSASDSKNVVPRYTALFFAGMKCLFAGDKNEAARYLRSSVEVMRVGPEARAAQAELKALTATATSTPTAAATATATTTLPNFAGTWEMISSVYNGKANPVSSTPLVITQNGSMVRIGNRDLQISNAGTVGYQTYAAHDNAHGHEVTSAAQADLIDTLTWRIEGSILVFETTFEYKHTYGKHSPGTDLRVMRFRLIGK